MDSILISVAFAFLATLCNVETKTQLRARPKYDLDDEDLTADRETQYYCDKLKTCTNGGPKVCGFDELTPWLAEFEDMCTLYKINCKSGRNIFTPVDQIICDTKIKYDKEHANETVEVIHVRSTTTDRPVLKSGNRTVSSVKLVKAQ